MKSYPYSHFIINDYNFIFWSNDNYDIEENAIQDYNWIKSTLEKARKNKKNEGDPIFVISHIPPKNTVYGSEGLWGHQGIFDILKDYPEVICWNLVQVDKLQPRLFRLLLLPFLIVPLSVGVITEIVDFDCYKGTFFTSL
jgi:hypothetical protein